MIKLRKHVHQFTKPLKIGNELLFERPLYYLEYRDKILSELSPLKGLHSEPLEKSLVILEKFLKQHFETILKAREKKEIIKKNQYTPFFGILKNSNTSKNIPTSVIFAIESLIINLIDQNSYPNVPLCGLDFQGDLNAVNDLSQFKFVKVKIGRENEKIEKEKIQRLLEKPDRFLRLDGNKKFDLKKLISLLNDLPLDRIQYLEDPFINNEELIKYDRYNCSYPPISLDESIINGINKNNLIQLKKVRFATLKPNLVGGITTTNKLARDLTKNNISCILSSSFESEIGLKVINNMHLQFAELYTIPAGLDTLKFFK